LQGTLDPTSWTPNQCRPVERQAFKGAANVVRLGTRPFGANAQ
jgi:hypothetical protein